MSNKNNNTDFDSTNDLVAFDSLSIKRLMKQRLNEEGVFTDQNFEGSNLSSLIDIISYSFNTLMFYLNRTSNESMFSESQIYENMNRIVKLLDYKPIGQQTSTLSFQASATGDLSIGTYFIPRYSFFRLDNNIIYSFNNDVSFSKTETGIEVLDDLNDNILLYQGKYIEHPVYNAIGEENEIVLLVTNDIIDHFNIDVYVKNAVTDTWEVWEQTSNLFLENATSRKYEIRLNEKKNYELKFGNDINGRKLNESDLVAIYYIESKGEAGEVGVGALNNKSPVLFNTNQYNEIQDDIKRPEVEFITLPQISNVIFDNKNVSTRFGTEEDVDSIRENAPGVFKTQYRLVTKEDYENYIKTNFANFINDVVVLNNSEYLDEYIRYFHETGLRDPNLESRVLFNQVQFSDACNFNNVYAFIVPKSIFTQNAFQRNYLTVSQKNFIINNIQQQKIVTSDIILTDPVYYAVSVGVTPDNQRTLITDKDNSELFFELDFSSVVNTDFIKQEVRNIFKQYFNKVSLGETVDVDTLENQIININGVNNFYTRRKNDTNERDEGLSLLIWNPAYEQTDVFTIGQNHQLKPFIFPYLFNIDEIINNIVFETDTIKRTQSIEI